MNTDNIQTKTAGSLPIRQDGQIIETVGYLWTTPPFYCEGSGNGYADRPFSPYVAIQSNHGWLLLTVMEKGPGFGFRKRLVLASEIEASPAR